jgi:type II secretory pathway component HofQ
MPSDRVQRHIDALLDDAEQAARAQEWERARELCEQVLTLDPENADARAFLAVAVRGLAGAGGAGPRLSLATDTR